MTRIAALIAATLTISACGAALDDEPERPRVVTTSAEITILESIRFARDTLEIETGAAMIDAIAETLKGNPDILLLEVQAAGEPGLALRRAELLVDELIARGVAPERLVPAASDDSSPGTHVEFVILERDNSERDTDASSCGG